MVLKKAIIWRSVVSVLIFYSDVTSSNLAAKKSTVLILQNLFVTNHNRYINKRPWMVHEVEKKKVRYIEDNGV